MSEPAVGRDEAVPATDDHRRQLGKGFNWLAGATLVAKIVDTGTILAMLLLLTKQQLGIASIVVSIGMVVEAFNGLGTSEALLQSRSVERVQLDTLFWYIVGAACVVGGCVLFAAPLIAQIYGTAGLAWYFVVIAIKQPVVGAAVIPLALMNRDLQYERIAIVNVCATLAAAVIRLGLGAAGAGSWALVMGYAASGVFILLGALLARPFRPRMRLELATIRPLMRFGLRAATANMGEQVFKNVDYLLVGWFYGAAQLAVYRVAFDVAMEPVMAIGTLVSRTALPVFARVRAVPAHMAHAFTWALRRVVLLVTPLVAGLILAAPPLMSLLHDRHASSYVAAAVPLQLLAAAALLRVLSQLVSAAMMGAGRPGTAARLSVTTLAVLAAGIVAAGSIFQAHAGIIAVSALWLAIYPLLMVWSARYLARHWHIRLGDLARSFAAPAVAVCVLVTLVMAARLLPLTDAPAVRFAVVMIATLLTYLGLFGYGRFAAARDASRV